MPNLPWEDNLLERKLESDLKDLLPTLVAFANAVKPGHIATILIGEKDDGTIQGVQDPDNIQKKIRKECDKIYPPIQWKSKVYEEEGKYCVRVEVEYDGETPHFGGMAWIRKGSENIKASDEVFQKLIEIRTSLIRELMHWENKEVSLSQEVQSGEYSPEKRWIRDVNTFYATFEDIKGDRVSHPLNRLTISYDHDHNRLKIIWRR